MCLDVDYKQFYSTFQSWERVVRMGHIIINYCWISLWIVVSWRMNFLHVQPCTSRLYCEQNFQSLYNLLDSYFYLLRSRFGVVQHTDKDTKRVRELVSIKIIFLKNTHTHTHTLTVIYCSSDCPVSVWNSSLMFLRSISQRLTTIRIRVSSSVPSPFIVFCSWRAKCLNLFLTHRTAHWQCILTLRDTFKSQSTRLKSGALLHIYTTMWGSTLFGLRCPSSLSCEGVPSLA